MNFSISVKEQKQIVKWLKKHRKTCDGYAGALGGALSYKFIPTGLGTITIVSCICKKELDVTDYGTW